MEVIRHTNNYWTFVYMVSFSRQYNESFSNISRKTICRKFVKKDKYGQLPNDNLCDSFSKLNPSQLFTIKTLQDS